MRGIATSCPCSRTTAEGVAKKNMDGHKNFNGAPSLTKRPRNAPISSSTNTSKGRKAASCLECMVTLSHGGSWLPGSNAAVSPQRQLAASKQWSGVVTEAAGCLQGNGRTTEESSWLLVGGCAGLVGGQLAASGDG